MHTGMIPMAMMITGTPPLITNGSQANVRKSLKQLNVLSLVQPQGLEAVFVPDSSGPDDSFTFTRSCTLSLG